MKLRLPHITRSTIFWPVLIVLSTALIAWQNFSPNTWLTGWDTLHPEFDFARNFRSLTFGVWREDQGLGALAAHSHMSELPRVFVLWLLSFAFPVNTVRYLYVFLCFVLGPLGVYYFVKRWVLSKHIPLVAAAGAFIAAMVYTFNLITLQQFYVVFEMFAVQYAALGWIFLTATNYFYSGKWRNLLSFFAVAALAAPMAYASLLWVAFAVSLAMYMLVLLLSKRTVEHLLRSISLGLVLLAANSYWLLPNLYFLGSDAARMVGESHINRLFSPESFLHNRAYGDWLDVLQMKNFLFSWQEFSPENRFQPLMQRWQEHLSNPIIWVLGFLPSALAVAGVTAYVRTLLRRNPRNSVPPVVTAVLPIAFLSLFALMNMNAPFTHLFGWLREQSALFEEGLRTPFTKFSLLYVFSLSVLASLWMPSMLQWVAQKTHSLKAAIAAVVTPITLALALLCLPYFQGHLIAPKIRRELPPAYTQLFEWFQSQPAQARVALLPLPSQFGWEYTSWGYEGAGFIWFGLEQSFLTRDFDRWNPENESFYNQLSYALATKNSEAFIATLEKYQVRYLLVDSSSIKPESEVASQQRADIAELLRGTPVRSIWKQDHLEVLSLPTVPSGYVHGAAAVIVASTDDATYADAAYTAVGRYVSEPDARAQNTQFLPFAQLQKVWDPGFASTAQLAAAQQLTLPTGSSISIPAPQTQSSYSTQATFALSGSVLTVQFAPPFVLELDQEQFAPEQLPPVELDLNTQSDALVLTFGGNGVLLEQNKPVTATLSLTVGRRIDIAYTDAQNARETYGVYTIPAELAQTTALPANTWEPVQQATRFTTSAPSSNLRVVFSAEPISMQLENPESYSNCSPTQSGTVEKVLHTTGATYYAQSDAIGCEILNAGLSANHSYVARITGENTAGRSIKVYVSQLHDYYSIEEMLPEGQFDSFISLPQLSSSEREYVLSLETRAFKHVASNNTLERVAIYPAPTQWVARISVQTAVEQNTYVPASVESVQKIGSYSYLVELAEQQAGNQLIALAQSHDPGWIAYPTGKPWTQLEHRELSGWANAWVIPPETSSVTLLYWPQLLNFVGYALFFAAVLILIPPALRNDRVAAKNLRFIRSIFTPNPRE